MRPRSLQSRLLLTFVTLMVLGLGGVILFSSIRLTRQILDRSQRDLQLQAQIIANALREPVAHAEEEERNNESGRSLDTLIGSYAQGVGGRLTLLDRNLRVIFSSDNLVPINFKASHREFVVASDGTLQSDIRTDEWRKEERLFVAVPLRGEHNEVMGWVQLSTPMTPIYKEILETWISYTAIGLAMLLVTAIASVVIARQIAVPVQKLTTTSEQIAAGKLDQRVSPEGPNEIQRLAVAFNRMTERVQEMIEQQREFVDNAAHELRSPLTSIRLRIEMLQTRGKNDPQLTQRYLGQMEREVGYLQRMIDHLLSLASIENNPDILVMTPLDLALLLYDVADSMGEIVRQAGLDFKTDIPERLPTVQANADQMMIMLRNLIDNAIKYTPRGGTILLTAKSLPNQVEIQVADTGVGIPADSLPHIFDRFYRVDKSHSRATGGTGLGLSLVQTIVQAHHGRIDATSQVNQGSTFTIHLPIQA
ncbi:MAG: HAMP domain-containing protein [Chloroflexi bacterium]|nr:HAMP domain-containing protein [Chloroflexota bacterium]